MGKAIVLAALAACGLVAGPASAQQAPTRNWSESADRIVFTPAKISLPRAISGLALKQTKDFSHAEQGLDSSARYESGDGAIFATTYVYYPSLSHGGLAAIATEEAMRSNSPADLRFGPPRRVDAGGVAGGALRADIANYQGRYASSAAFIKAGRWIVKFRVSGPQARAAEVSAAMTALIADSRFEGAARPMAQQPIDAPACPQGTATDAKLLSPGGPDADVATMADALLATFDPAGTAAAAGKAEAVPPRIGRGWCKAYAAVGTKRIPLLRATDVAGSAPFGSSRLFALYSDAGGAVEVVQQKQRFTLFHHEIGRTTVMGTFDRVPSDSQMAAMLGRDHEALAPRARVNLTPDGGSNIELQVADTKPTPTT
jgi:hypothetical protein